jgi:hypothetical protein
MQLTTDKELGKGFNGIVYACKYNKKLAICKLEKYIDTEDRFERQRRFNTVAKKHPDRFLTLELSAIINDYDYDIFNIDISLVPAEQKERVKQLQKSTQCSMLIYTPVLKYTLASVKHRLNDDLRKSIYMHLKKSIDIMHKENWRSNDIHDGNIMCIDWQTPTSYYIIDYGEISNILDKPTAMDKLVSSYANDYISLCWCMLYDNVFNELTEMKINIHLQTVVKKCRQLVPKGIEIDVTFRCYVKHYAKYLLIIGCSKKQIDYAKQDPIAIWLYDKLP